MSSLARTLTAYTIAFVAGLVELLLSPFDDYFALRYLVTFAVTLVATKLVLRRTAHPTPNL